ncbi:MAG: hypothetical protein ACK6CP_01610 [Pseudanabaena sp.]|jgi:ferredoxin-like protein FixX|nr:hypothetical protein [Pseudanabaena sp. M109S1SP2A07QC]MCA6519620.1 hypothetical protein [Pseudanabaena sp. M110S1SP2A07QC]MCA6524975.1 hypothetical protein [Pseudanabaena sp. M179S2SP2A07QC]MCE2887094.1 hypothetical protein [Pseudanabaena sp. 42896M_M3]
MCAIAKTLTLKDQLAIAKYARDRKNPSFKSKLRSVCHKCIGDRPALKNTPAIIFEASPLILLTKDKF